MRICVRVYVCLRVSAKGVCVFVCVRVCVWVRVRALVATRYDGSSSSPFCSRGSIMLSAPLASSLSVPSSSRTCFRSSAKPSPGADVEG